MRWPSQASVAQLAEQLALNQRVLGSSPSRGITKDAAKAAFFFAP